MTRHLNKPWDNGCYSLEQEREMMKLSNTWRDELVTTRGVKGHCSSAWEWWLLSIGHCSSARSGKILKSARASGFTFYSFYRHKTGRTISFIFYPYIEYTTSTRHAKEWVGSNRGASSPKVSEIKSDCPSGKESVGAFVHLSDALERHWRVGGNSRALLDSGRFPRMDLLVCPSCGS